MPLAIFVMFSLYLQHDCNCCVVQFWRDVVEDLFSECPPFCLSSKVAEHQKEIMIKKQKKNILSVRQPNTALFSKCLHNRPVRFFDRLKPFWVFLLQLLGVLLRAETEVQSPSDRQAFCLRRKGSTYGIPYARRTKLTIIEPTLNTKWNTLKSNQP